MDAPGGQLGAILEPPGPSGSPSPTENSREDGCIKDAPELDLGDGFIIFESPVLDLTFGRLQSSILSQFHNF